MASSSETGGGIGLCGFLFLIFLVLKLCGVIAWSWWWVTAPLWIPMAIGLVLCVVFVLLLVAAAIFTH